MPISNYFTNTPFANAPSGDQMVQSSLEAMLNPNSQYIQNARQRGVEYAAQRGGLNSSIAAGASERAAIEAAQPLVNQSLDITKNREGIVGQEWLASQNFNREIQGAMTMLPATSAFHMLDTLQQYALQDPELYTPDVVSGYSNFFTQNMQNIISQYFGDNLQLQGVD
jgi:hypothetical protein